MNIHQNLLKFGFFYQENFLKYNEILNLKNFFKNQFLDKNLSEGTIKYDYQFLYKYPEIDCIEKKISKFLKKNISYDIYLRNIWMISTNKQNFRKNNLPFIPHIDKKRYLKVFLYVEDVNYKDGPFTVCSNTSPIENEQKRINWKSTDKSEHGLRIDNNNLKYKSMIFKSGTIICFDTNTPHYAGAIEKDGSRKVLRFNYFSNFNTTVSLNYITSKLKNNLSRIKNQILNKNIT